MDKQTWNAYLLVCSRLDHWKEQISTAESKEELTEALKKELLLENIDYKLIVKKTTSIKRRQER